MTLRDGINTYVVSRSDLLQSGSPPLEEVALAFVKGRPIWNHASGYDVGIIHDFRNKARQCVHLFAWNGRGGWEWDTERMFEASPDALT